jgi:hypothetical protein
MKKQKSTPEFNDQDIDDLDNFQSQEKKEGFGVDVVEIFSFYLDFFYNTRNKTYLNSGNAISKYAHDYFSEHIDEFKNGGNIDIEVPFAIADQTGKKKICFLQCSHCGDYFVKFSHHALLCRACRVIRKSDTQKERRALAKKLREVKYCLHCGKMILKGSSAKKDYCSGACRTAACRKRVITSH